MKEYSFMIETPIYKILEAAAGASSSVSSAASSISKSAVRLPIPRVSINVYLHIFLSFKGASLSRGVDSGSSAVSYQAGCIVD